MPGNIKDCTLSNLRSLDLFSNVINPCIDIRQALRIRMARLEKVPYFEFAASFTESKLFNTTLSQMVVPFVVLPKS